MPTESHALHDAAPDGGARATLLLLPPPPDLAPLVEYVWQLTLPGGGGREAFWRVVVDGYVDVALRLALDPALMHAAGRAAASDAARRSVLDAIEGGPLVVCGAARAARALPLPVPLLLTGIRFRMGSATAVLRSSVAELVDGSRPLRDVLDGRAGLDAGHALVSGAETNAALHPDRTRGGAIPDDAAAERALRVIKRTAVLALTRRLIARAAGGARPEAPDADARVRGALRLLDQSPVHVAPRGASHGEGRVAAVARELAVSPRTLERLFSERLGFAPRTYQRLRRVGAVTAALERAAGAAAGRVETLSELAHALGYADHAHMTREFTAAMGVAPSAYRRDALNAPVVRHIGGVRLERAVPFGTIGRPDRSA